ncbi:MAG TPA: IS4 family transposase [Candidatus Angelobacter sp.]
MRRVCSIFSQILQFFPRLEFEAAVKKHNAERHARGFTCWQQMVAMLFCQLGHAQSLREICGGLAAVEGKLTHLGIAECPRTTTLSYANKHRPWQLYQTVFETVLGRCQVEALRLGRRKFRFKHKLLSLDASMVELCAESFDWAKYKQTKGALKLHLVLDHDGHLPCYAVMTEGKTADISEARKMHFEAGTLLVFDRGYSDYRWWLDLTRGGVSFVTRLKDGASYGVIETRAVPEGSNILRDEVIVLTSQQDLGPEARLRRIEILLEDTNETMVFVTNNLRLAARTIARIYKERWQIELFFKALKQGLKVKTFVGTSENAVQIQIWTALIAMLILKYLQLKSTFGWSLSNLVALLRQQLFVHRDLMQWIDDPFQGPLGVEDPQLALAL